MEEYEIVGFQKPNYVKLKAIRKSKEVRLSKNKVKRMLECEVIKLQNPEVLLPRI